LGQKVHPTGFRLGVVKGWQSRWYAERGYKELLAEDFMLRKQIQKELANASISRIEIERAAANQVSVTIHTAKPGIVIGKSGEKVDRLRTALEAKTKKRVRLNIVEIRQPELDAYLVGRSIAEQLEKRVSFRRAMKQAVQKTMRSNAKGIRVVIGGRLGGAEIARSEKEVEGKIPLHTLRADIDYGLTEAHTTFGVIGIKVWIYKGDILPTKRREEAQQESTLPFAPRDRAEAGERRGERRPPRGARPQSGERQQRGERPARAQGERAPRGERTTQSGERTPRAPRAQGERPARPAGERPTRSRRTESATGEAPVVQEAQKVAGSEIPVVQDIQEATVPETQKVAGSEIPVVQDIQEATVPETQKAAGSEVPAVQDIQETTVPETQTPPPPATDDGASESE
jgi:small subunit ribosomal protein S3